MVANGYGLYYNIREENIIFSVVSRRSSQETSASEFCGAIEKSLEEMHALCEFRST